MGGMRSAYVQYIKHGLTQPIRLSFPGNVLSWSPVGWGFWFPLTTLHQSKPWGMDIHNDCFLSSSRTRWVHGLSFSPINLIERDHLPGTIIFCRSCPFHSESIITMYGSFLWRFFSHFIELFLVHSFDPINFSYVLPYFANVNKLLFVEANKFEFAATSSTEKNAFLLLF